MNRLFKLIKSMPGHDAGDLLAQLNNSFTWTTPPFYQVEATQVLNHPEFFIEIFHEWEESETFYFIGMNGLVYEQPFDCRKHGALVNYHNAFKTKEQATTIKDSITSLMNNEAMVVNKSDLCVIQSLLRTGKHESAIEQINKWI